MKKMKIIGVVLIGIMNLSSLFALYIPTKDYTVNITLQKNLKPINNYYIQTKNKEILANYYNKINSQFLIENFDDDFINLLLRDRIRNEDLEIIKQIKNKESSNFIFKLKDKQGIIYTKNKEIAKLLIENGFELI